MNSHAPVPSRLAGHPVGHEAFASFGNVTPLMLARAISVCQGTASGEAPLFYWAKNARRIGICRETTSTI
jgi:hypothetical protein